MLGLSAMPFVGRSGNQIDSALVMVAATFVTLGPTSPTVKLVKRPAPAVPANNLEESVGSNAMALTRRKPSAFGLVSQKETGVARAFVKNSTLVDTGPVLLVVMMVTSVTLLEIVTNCSAPALFDQLPPPSVLLKTPAAVPA